MKSEPILRRIVEAGDVKKIDTILEIGPGKGALTEKLLERAGTVIAVEKDYELFEFLKKKFEKEIKIDALMLVHGDILEFDTSTYNLDPRPYKVISNIPYNITGAILKKFLSAENKPESMTLMVQKEVAERIVGLPRPRKGGASKESLLSISVKAYGKPKILFKVGRGNFFPAPNVDSAVIKIENISGKLFDSPLEEYPLGEGGRILSTPSRKRATPQEGNFEYKFWEIVRAGFAHKRKKLGGNLKGVCQGAPLTEYADKRAEDLTVKDWLALVKKCYN